ncbi:hypothetical protein SAY87_024344 [Trapa incisa]|uniref:SAM domain-containing protein n=1 Tax=Trapa incisa TaxID=236973 RepID=A0AAN7G9K4_9MYRT|nr:hypothetical protein SAY87_024344 [Trapa incisa]
MAAELQQSEKPAARLSSGTTADVPDQSEDPHPAEDWLLQDNRAPQSAASKRRRRPSVRLRDIGDQKPDEYKQEPLALRPNWRLPKDSPYRKARSLTHLVNGSGDSDFSPPPKKQKMRRIGMSAGFSTGTAAKRTRSSRASSPDEAEEYKSRDWGDDDEDEEQGGGDGTNSRDFQRSPEPSAEYDMEEPNSWQRRVNQNPESVNRDMKSDGVRSWLLELGLSRYAPIFEVHEVDDEVLPMLTLEDLKDMGISAVGSRRKMYSAILKLQRKGLS